MKITMQNVALRMAWLALVLCLVAAPAVSALALDISGTVSYGGSKTGRVYLSVYWQDGNSTGLGTSIVPPETYTIRGLQPGSYIVKAFMDTHGYGVPNTVDPLGQSGLVTVSGTSQSGIEVPLIDSSPTVPPSPPRGILVTPGDNSVLVMWEGPKDNNEFEAAESYNVYWSTDSDVMGTYGDLGGSVTGIPAREDGHVFLPFANGTVLYFAVTSQIGGTASTTATVTPTATTIGNPSVGTSVSGTVSFSGTPPSGPLFIGINPPDGGPVAYTVIPSPSFPQTFTVNGVPAGSYYIFAFIDTNSNGTIDTDDPATARGNEPLVLVSGDPLGGVAVQLSDANASISTRTTHASNGFGDWYSLQFETYGIRKLPVTVTLESGPNITGPLDIGLSQWGGFQYYTGAPRPNVGDTYNFTVHFADAPETPQAMTSQVTAVLDSFANPLRPVGDTYGPTVTAPTFAWEAPTDPPPPLVYSYGLRLNQQYDWVWQLDFVSMTQSSANYNYDDQASQPSLALDTTYTWAAILRDAYGNQTEREVSFTPRSTSVQTGSAGGTYTYDSGTGQLTLNWTSAGFPCDGPSVGQEIQNVTVLTETTLTWTNGNDSMTWTRISAEPSGIVGTWRATDPASGNTYTLILGGDGSMSVSASIYQCSNPQPQISGFTPDTGPVGSKITIYGSNFDGNPFNNTVTINGTLARVDFASPSQLIVTVMGGTTSGQISVTTQNGTGASATSFTVGPAPGTAGGTYTYNPDQLDLNWTSSNFVCDGPQIGQETQTVTTLDATTMVWQDGMTWTRSPAGTPGDIVGSWTATDSGNTYTLTFNTDGSMSVNATISQCNGDFQAPTVPTGVTAQAISYSQINVTWNASTDNDVNYYQVYRNGQPAGTPGGQNNTLWQDYSVSPNTTYSYTVAACDFNGNCSAQSSPPAQATTPGIPVVPVFMIYGGVLHLASSDTFGGPVDALQMGIGKVGTTLGGMTATVSGPNGFSYTFSDADVRPYLGGQFEVYKEFTSPLETGVYTFTLNDGNGTISNRVDTHANPQKLPAVDSATIQAQRKSDGSYRFTWAPVNDTKTYFYSLRINKADGTHTPVWPTQGINNRSMNGYEDVPAGTLVDGTAYEVRVRVGDGPDFSLTFNQANSAFVSPFTPQASDYDDSRLMFNYTSANNVSGDDPTFSFRLCTAAPTPVCGQTQANLVTSFTLTGPAGFSYTNSTPSTELISPNLVDFVHKVPTAVTGSYMLDVTANGKHHYAYLTLTPAVSYPTPVLANYKAEDLGNGSIRFSWSDADYNGALYYRVYVQDSAGATAYTASQRTNQAWIDMTKTSLGLLTTKRWRVEVYDSSSANTQRNRINGEWTASGTLNSLPAYDGTKPAIGQFRFRNLNHPGGSATDIATVATDNSTPLGAVLVNGPGGFSRNLLMQGTGGSTGSGPYNFNYSMAEAGAPASGLYTLSVTDSDANNVVRFNQQPTPHDVPMVDYRTFKVNTDANGDSRFSWAPVVTDVPVWYSLELVAVNTMTSISVGLNNVQQASVTVPSATMQSASLQGPLMFRVRVSDGSGWSTTNNISQAAFAGYSVNFDFATLADSDGDGFASNVDPDDGNPTINPYAATGGTYSIFGRVTDQVAAPLSDIAVLVFNASTFQLVANTTTDGSGNYAVTGLLAGSYKVQFMDPTLSHDAIWYSGQHDSGSAAAITFYGPALTSFTANAALTSGQTGGISGRVTDGVNGIAGVMVGALLAADLTYASGAITDANGYYVIGGLTTGDYKVYFSGSSTGFQDLWYNAATPVHVNASGYVIDINGVLGRFTSTTAVLSSGSNPSYAGDPLYYTATVSPTPTSGTIQFRVDGVNVGGPVVLVGGSATSAAITSMLPGIHSVTAEFSGCPGYAGSISIGVSQTANPKVMIGSNGNYLTLQSAVDASLNGDTLLLRDVRFAEDLLINATVSRPAAPDSVITIKGGLDSNFATPAANFTSVRKLTINYGKVIASRLAVRPDPP